MSLPYAEVIGDPIAHSKSPAIHRHWLQALDLTGDYRAAHVRAEELGSYLRSRRDDPDWRGCNVTIPHKESVVPLLDVVDPAAREIGAVNCISKSPEGLTGHNSDVDGIAAALAGAEIAGRKVALIGAGGAARAAVRYLAAENVGEIAMLVRDPVKAQHFADRYPQTVTVHRLDGADAALGGSSILINASPLGMNGASPMPQPLLDAVTRHAAPATTFDMVYNPLETPFLAAARASGGTCVDGLVMLIGQARAAFRFFFGQEPCPGDEALRDLLAT